MLAILIPLSQRYLGTTKESLLPRHLLPFPGPTLSTAISKFTDAAYSQRMLWGSYRPGYYFGLRPRVPKSLVFGSMWCDPTSPSVLERIRHEARQEDGLKQYGWVAHDGETFGRQGLIDEKFNITTSFVKPFWKRKAGGGFDGLPADVKEEWAARIEVKSVEGPADVDSDAADIISFFFYIATEDGSEVVLDRRDVRPQSQDESLAMFAGKSSALGVDWGMYVAQSNPERMHVYVHNSMSTRTPHLHNLTDTVRNGLWSSILAQRAQGSMQLSLSLPNTAAKRSNVAILQVTGLLPLSFDISFMTRPMSRSRKSSFAAREKVIARPTVGEALTAMLVDSEREFNDRFEQTFESTSPGNKENDQLLFGQFKPIAKAALSNMLGGIGYWHGHSLVLIKSASEQLHGNIQKVVPLWDTSLFASTPSRSFFPRGFLWDEGFHQLVIRRWSRDMSRDILSHWFDAMTVNGWIPREQILGEEARSRVPAEFIPQSPQAANPPTLFLPLLHAATSAASNDSQDYEFLRAAWPRLRNWYEWYNSSQGGPVPGSYRWRGRMKEDATSIIELNPKTLTSGLDDYPRASHPSADERHLDLRCWMALAARAMATIGRVVGASQAEVEWYTADANYLSEYEQLKALHWDAENGHFADWGNHTEEVDLVATVDQGTLQRVVTTPPRLRFVPQYGYVSLFPLAMGLIPPHAPELATELASLRDASIWTPYGLRSLSNTSSIYNARNTEHDPPYWRGAVWMNINYLVLRALEGYSKHPHVAQTGVGEEAAAMAHLLRSSLISTVTREYTNRGYLFEQYDDQTGQGKGCHPFTGWTSLVVLMTSNDSENLLFWQSPETKDVNSSK